MRPRRLLLVLLALVALAALVAGGYGLSGIWDLGDRAGHLGDQPGGDLASDGRETGATGPRLEGAGQGDLAAAPGTPQAPAPVDLETVDRERDLHGVVLGPQERPVAGATLQIVGHPWRRTNLVTHRYDEEVAGPTTTSAADGTFAIPLRRGVRVGLRVRAQGLASIEVEDCQAGERLRVVLRTAVALVVLVKDASGAPLSEVDLTVRSRGRDNASWHAKGRTGEDGRHRFEGLPAGARIRLEAAHGALGGWHGDIGDPVILPDHGEAEREIVIRPGWIVRGRVTDAETQAPVAGARVGMGWTFFKEARTDEEGRYALGGWTGDGYHQIHVQAEGYAEASRSVGRLEVVDFVLERGFAVTGRLVDGRARPLAGAIVAAVGSAHDGPMTQRISRDSERTDAQGRFHLADLCREIPHLLVAMPEGHGRLVLALPSPPADEALLDLGDVLVPAGRTISGRVLDHAGAPLPGVEVTCSGGGEAWDRLAGADPAHAIPSLYGRDEELRTDDLGRFAFADLAPGTYVLTAAPDGARKVSREVVLGPGADATGIELRMEDAWPLEVRLRDRRGGTISGVLLLVSPAGAEDLMVRTDARGSARAALPRDAGTVRIHVLDLEGRPYVSPDETACPPDAGVVTIMLEEALLLRGRLLGPNGAPLVLASLDGRRGEARVAGAQTDSEGDFTMRVPPGGPVDLVFEGTLYGIGGARRVPLAASLSGAPPDAQGIVLRAQPVPEDRELTVRVFSPSGAPVAGALVRLDPPPTPGHEGWRTGADGRASVAGLVGAPVQVKAQPPEADRLRWFEARRGDVVPAGQEVTLTLKVPLLLAGVVVGPDGAALEGAQVTHQPWLDFRVTTDTEGRFVLPLDPDYDEPVTLHATRSHEGSSHFLSAEVGGVDPREGPVRIQLAPDRGW